jgi:hypothetical protein
MQSLAAKKELIFLRTLKKRFRQLAIFMTLLFCRQKKWLHNHANMLVQAFKHLQNSKKCEDPTYIRNYFPAQFSIELSMFNHYVLVNQK